MNMSITRRLERLMFLSYALHVMGEELDIDEAGLDIEHFELIDMLLGDYLQDYDVAEMKQELISMVLQLNELGGQHGTD